MFDSEHIIDKHEFAFENLKITINERCFDIVIILENGISQVEKVKCKYQVLNPPTLDKIKLKEEVENILNKFGIDNKIKIEVFNKIEKIVEKNGKIETPNISIKKDEVPTFEKFVESLDIKDRNKVTRILLTKELQFIPLESDEEVPVSEKKILSLKFYTNAGITRDNSFFKDRYEELIKIMFDYLRKGERYYCLNRKKFHDTGQKDELVLKFLNGTKKEKINILEKLQVKII